MKTSPTITVIAPALVAALAELQPVTKDSINPAFRNKYASLDGIMEQIRPVLARHGMAVIQTGTAPETIDGRLMTVGVETLLLHKSGEWVSSSVMLPVEKVTAQGLGSALSYGRRYSLSALLGLSATDDDGNEASVRPATPSAAAAPVAPAEAGQRLYSTVPDTPRAKPFSGKTEDALNFKLPFKKSKFFNVALGEIPQPDLESLLDFLKRDPDKFGDLITRVQVVLEHWFGEDANAEADARKELDDLPF